MIKLGLTGFPLSHSLSPRIQAAALQSCGLVGSYSLFPIHLEDKQSLEDLLNQVRSGEIHGLNVTIPHKQKVIPFLDELTPSAVAIGAVNTIYLRNDKLIGENTDAPGFLADLKKFITTETLGRGELRALVLGAGGSARAVIYALLNDGWNLSIAARRPEQAQQLAAYFKPHELEIANYDLSGIDLSNMALVINTTPLGMTPHVNQSPWPDHLSLPEKAAIYDLVYNPQQTRLVKDARAQGLSATTGLGMLIEQAALAFEIWTGYHPSREVMRTSVEESPVSNY